LASRDKSPSERACFDRLYINSIISDSEDPFCFVKRTLNSDPMDLIFCPGNEFKIVATVPTIITKKAAGFIRTENSMCLKIIAPTTATTPTITPRMVVISIVSPLCNPN